MFLCPNAPLVQAKLREEEAPRLLTPRTTKIQPVRREVENIVSLNSVLY
jgi:hypothetical protein